MYLVPTCLTGLRVPGYTTSCGWVPSRYLDSENCTRVKYSVTAGTSPIAGFLSKDQSFALMNGEMWPISSNMYFVIPQLLEQFMTYSTMETCPQSGGRFSSRGKLSLSRENRKSLSFSWLSIHLHPRRCAGHDPICDFILHQGIPSTEPIVSSSMDPLSCVQQLELFWTTQRRMTAVMCGKRTTPLASGKSSES